MTSNDQVTLTGVVTFQFNKQVHGIAHDTIEFVQKIITTEMNSATDNPIVLPERGEVIDK